MIVDIEKLGKKYKVIVPDDADPELWQYGVVVGPPDLSSLDLSPSMEVRLHNELYVRGLITKVDIMRRGVELVAALQAVLKVDAQRIAELYN